ncbi:MAG: hypothetical protein ACAH59_06600, partial [Pseudobdellovibrionaceae bacterium]
GKTKPVSNIEILSPRLTQTQYVTPAKNKINFQWKGFPEKAKVSLWLGKNRKTLKPSSFTETNSLQEALTPGIHLWKLVATDASGRQLGETSVFRLKVLQRQPPTLLQPEENSILTLSMVNFKWLNPEDSEKIGLEVGKDPELKQKFVSEAFSEKENYQTELPNGDYWLKLSARYPDSEEWISSRIVHFKIGPDSKTLEPAPLAAPLPLQISWTENTKDSIQYFTQYPRASYSWTAINGDKVRQWRFKIAEKEESLRNPAQAPLILKETQEMSFETPLPKPGRYIAQVEALDEKNQVLATSEMKSLEILPLPALKAPSFLPLNSELKADLQGRLNLKWTAIDGAQNYTVILMDSAGKEIRKAKFQGLSATLVNLLPGEYKVSVHAIDSHGRESEKQIPRPVQVPDSSDLQAPKFKKIEVN